MDDGLTRARIFLGPNLMVVRETDDGVELEGRSRLRPGREVDLVYPPAAGGQPVRRAAVLSWRVARVGAAGVVFRGECRWARVD
jgi:hypothetical protein